MSKRKSWLKRIGERHARHVRLHHETQHAIIKDKIERNPDSLLKRVRKLESEISILKASRG